MIQELKFTLFLFLFFLFHDFSLQTHWKDNGRYIIQVKTNRAIVLGNAHAIID